MGSQIENAIPDGTNKDGLASDMADGLRAASDTKFREEHSHISGGRMRLNMRRII